MTEAFEAKKKQLKDELDKLQYEFKVELPQVIAKARSFGDLKENAEYHAARERQSFVKAKISQLAEQLSNLSSVSADDIPTDRIGFGSVVTVVDLDMDDEISFTLVSPDEVNPAEGKISLSSPVGVALANKKVGEEVIVTIPAGKRQYRVQKITTIHGNEHTA